MRQQFFFAAVGCVGVALTSLSGCATRADAQTYETARSAASFIDSIGVNVHLSYHDGPYGRFAAIAPLLHTLGVQHVRDGVSLGQNDVCREDRTLAAGGIHMDFLTQASLTQAQLANWAACVGPAIDAYEGLNEYDISHGSDPNWVQTVRTAQRALYHNVKSDAALAHLAVIGPSFTSEGAFRAVGDLSSDMDAGNMHNYFAGHEPGTGGWGLNGYGSIAYNEAAARMTDGTKPIESTETGYATERQPKSVDDATQAAYVPRMFLEQFNAGIERTYEYELVDEGGPPFGHYGLVANDLTPKPAFTALASLIATLRDSGDAATAPKQLRYALTGAATDVHHTLLQKHDGRFELVLWRETASWDPDRNAAIAVPPAPVAVAVDEPLRAATLYTYDGTMRLRPRALHVGAPLQVAVTDRASVLELVPAGAGR